MKQGQQKLKIQQQNADTARAGAASNILTNASFNPQGFGTASQTVPAIRNALGQPTVPETQDMFGLKPQKDNSPQMFRFMDLFRTDD